MEKAVSSGNSSLASPCRKPCLVSNPAPKKFPTVPRKHTYLPKMWQLPVGFKDTCRTLGGFALFFLLSTGRAPTPPRARRRRGRALIASDLLCDQGSVNPFQFCCLLTSLRVFVQPGEAAPRLLRCYLSFPARDL